MTKLVSIVMPTYNQGEFIEQALKSIKSQIYTNWELIIIDDGSTDNTRELVTPYLDDTRITYHRKLNGGTGSALNYGFELARGEYETWWASDNVMYSHMLCSLVEGIEEASNCGHIYSDCHSSFMDETGLVELRKCKFSELVGDMSWDEERFQKGYFLGICWLWRAEWRIKCGFFQSEPCEDYDMALRMVEEGCRFAFIPTVCGMQRRHSKNLTNTVVDENGDPNAKTRFVHNKALKRREERLAGEKTRAASREKYLSVGKGKLKIAIINLEFDCAGVGWNLKQAIEKYTPHHCRHITRRITTCNAKTNLLLTPSTLKEYENIIQWADVLHFNQWIWNHNPYQHATAFEWNSSKDSPLLSYDKYFKTRRVFFHFHSGELLAAPAFYEEEARRVGARILTCDPPSSLCVKGARWIPNVLELDLPKAERMKEKLGVYSGHGPNDDRKNVALYKRYIETMSKNGIPISFENVFGIEKSESFSRRRKFQVALESLIEGHIGMVGWEAMGMGQVVLARVAPCTLESYTSLGSPPPIINCDSVALMMKELRELQSHPSYLVGAMNKSRIWMEKHYQPEKIVQMYLDEYLGVA